MADSKKLSFSTTPKRLLHSYSNSSQINGYQGWDEILMITLISSKNIGVYKIMRNTVTLANSYEQVTYPNLIILIDLPEY